MAGIEEIMGHKGNWYIRAKLMHLDENYLQKIFLVEDADTDLARLNKKLALVDHFAHLYGPVTLVEDQKADIFRTEAANNEDPDRKIGMLLRQESLRSNNRYDRTSSLPAGVELRRRTTIRSSRAPLDVTKADVLRKAFRNHPRRKFPTANPDERDEIKEQLRQRHITAQCITELVRQNSFPGGQRRTNSSNGVPNSSERRSLPSNTPEDDQVILRPRRLIRSELGDAFPEEVEGIDVILDRAEMRRQRSSGGSESDSYPHPFTSRQDVLQLQDISETEMDVFLPNKE